MFTLLILTAIGIMFWWFAGQIIGIFSGDLDTFLGKLLGYFVIFAVFTTIFG